MVTKALFLAANTNKQAKLQLDSEYKKIRNYLAVTPERDALHIVPEFEINAFDLQQLLELEKPEIIHFAGHGDAEGHLLLQGSRVSPEAVEALLRGTSADVRLVILNCCYSTDAASAAVKHVSFGVGIQQEIDDAVAIHFSACFYQGLGFGRTIEDAFHYAEAGIAIANGKIPKDQQPQLFSKPDNDPNAIRLVSLKSAELSRRHNAEIEEWKFSRKIWFLRGLALSVFFLGSTLLIVLICLPKIGWLLPAEAKHLKEEVARIGGNLKAPGAESATQIMMRVTNARTEEMTSKPSHSTDQRNTEQQLMNAWQTDLFNDPPGDGEVMLVAQSPKSFSPPYKSCIYNLNVAPDVRLMSVAAFLVRDAGDDTSYRPVYRQMHVVFKPEVDIKGTMFLDRPRSRERLWVLIWVATRPGDQRIISNLPGKSFNVTLTDRRAHQ